MIKTIKKILLAVVILGVVAVAVIGFGTYKIADETLKSHEPQLRQYLQLDAAAQDKFILENIDNLLSEIDVDKDGKPEEKEEFERFKKLNARPDIQKAFVEVGRSLMASFIMLSEPIVKDMNAELKTKYQKESEEFEARLDKYSKLIEAADPKFKAEK